MRNEKLEGISQSGESEELEVGGQPTVCPVAFNPKADCLRGPHGYDPPHCTRYTVCERLQRCADA